MIYVLPLKCIFDKTWNCETNETSNISRDLSLHVVFCLFVVLFMGKPFKVWCCQTVSTLTFVDQTNIFWWRLIDRIINLYYYLVDNNLPVFFRTPGDISGYLRPMTSRLPSIRSLLIYMRWIKYFFLNSVVFLYVTFSYSLNLFRINCLGDHLWPPLNVFIRTNIGKRFICNG